MLQFLERLNVVNYTDSFLSGQEINQYASLTILGNCFHNFLSCEQLSCNPMTTDFLNNLLHCTVQWEDTLLRLPISCIALSSGKIHYCDFPNHLPSIVCVEHISSVFIAFHGGGFWSTSVRQIIDILVAISEVFHPILHAAGTHEGITIDMTKLNKDILQQNCSLL
jgi:hypothetical protein